VSRESAACHSKSRRAGSSAAQGTPVPPLGTSVRPGPSAELDRYIGYWKPYARTLLEGVLAKRAGLVQAGSALEPPRQS